MDAVVKRALPSSVLAFQLRVVCDNRQSVLEVAFPPRGIGIRSILHSVHVSMMSALLTYRRRPIPIASVSAIAASELTSGYTIRTSVTILGPSQGLADTEFRNVRSTRSVTSQRQTVRTLCMSLCADVELVTPVRHTEDDPRHRSGDDRDLERIFYAQCGSARANLRSLPNS